MIGGEGVFYVRDHGTMFRRLLFQVARAYHAGRWPLWDESAGGGEALGAYPNAMAWSPYQALFFLPVSFDRAYAYFIVLHLPVAMGGAYLLSRDLGCRPISAGLAAVMYAFSGTLLSLNNVLSMFESACFGPLMIALALRLVRAPSLAGAALFAAVAAFHVQSADPIFLVADALVFLVVGGRALLFGGVRSFSALAAATVLAAALAAVQIAPIFEVLRGTPRGAGFPYEEVSIFSLHPVRLLELFFPGLTGDPERLLTLFSTDSSPARRVWLFSVYLGAGALPLVAFAASRRGARRLLVLAAVFAVLALGRFLPAHRWLVEVVPGLMTSRYPVKLAYGVTLSLSLAAALGLEALIAEPRPPRIPRAAAVVLILCGAAAIVLCALDPGWTAPWRSHRVTDAVAREVLVRAAVHGLLAAAAGGAIFMAAVRGRIAASWVGPAFVVVLALDLALASVRILPTAPSSIYDRPKVADLILADASAPSVFQYGFFATPDKLGDFTTADLLRFMNQRLTPGVGVPLGVRYVLDPDVSDFRPEFWHRLWRYFAALPRERYRLQMLRRLGVTHVLLDRTADPWPGTVELGRAEVEGGEPVSARRILGSRPRLAWLGGVEVARSQEEALSAMTSTGAFDRAIVEKSELDRLRSKDERAAGEVEALAARGGSGVSSGSVAETAFEPGEIRAVVTATVAGLVVAAQRFDSGWKAEVDGRPAAVVRAEGMLAAVPVAAGERSLHLFYRPDGFWWGLRLTVLGWIAVAALLAGARVRARQRRP